MSQSITTSYGSSNQSITCTITSLANNGQRQSTAIDNTTNLFLDALVTLKTKTAASSTSASGYVAVYAYGTADGGTTYDEGLAGSDGSATLTAPPNLNLIGVLNAVANSTTYVKSFSVAQAFGGIIPAKWGIVVENKTGATLDASVGTAFYQGVKAIAS